MKPTREELLNAGFELEKGFRNTYVKKITDTTIINIWYGGLNSFNCSVGKNHIYDENIELTKENLNRIHEHYTGEPLNFEKKEEWKRGNVLMYNDDETFIVILGEDCNRDSSDLFEAFAIESKASVSLEMTNITPCLYTKIAETPEEYYRQKFESEKSNEPKEKVKEVEPQIGEVWDSDYGYVKILAISEGNVAVQYYFTDDLKILPIKCLSCKKYLG